MAKCQHKLFKQIQVLAQAPAQALMGARRPASGYMLVQQFYLPKRDASPPFRDWEGVGWAALYTQLSDLANAG